LRLGVPAPEKTAGVLDIERDVQAAKTFLLESRNV